MKYLLLLTLMFSLLSCQTVTISDKGFKIARNASFEDTKWFFLWGLFPRKKQVNLSNACGHRGVSQIQTLDTFFDSLIGLLTLGIIAPRTAKVWCKK